MTALGPQSHLPPSHKHLTGNLGLASLGRCSSGYETAFPLQGWDLFYSTAPFLPNTQSYRNAFRAGVWEQGSSHNTGTTS